MAIVLPVPLTPQEIRVLQEFRRLGAETLTLDAIRAIRHPAGGGDGPAYSLAAKGYLTAVDGEGAFALTGKAKEFLAIEAKPETAESGSGGNAAD